VNDLVVKNVELFGDTVIAAQDENGVIWAGVKWFCEGLGLSKGQMQGERKKIQEDAVLSKGERNLTLPTKGGKQDVLCLQLDFVPLWLAKISITPAMKENNPELVDKLIKYQLRAKDILAAAFLTKKKEHEPKQQEERLASVNNAVKILTPMLKAAGCDSKIQLLTAKTLYEKAGVALPIQIEADKQYYDTVHIARKVGLYYQSSEKPADKAVNEIIRRLDLSEDMYVETWESKGKWQGTVRKYAAEVISMVKQWYADNGYPREIEYTQCDGQVKKYHVLWRDMEVA